MPSGDSAPEGDDARSTQRNRHALAEDVKLSFLIRAVMIVGTGGFIFGYDIGVISGSIDSIASEFSLTDLQIGAVISVLYVGSIFGCAFGEISDRIGRWKTIHIQNLVFILGAIFISGASTIGSLYIGRILVGVASTLSGIADVPYLLEISPPSKRGIFTGIYEVLICVGVLASFVSNFLLRNSETGWRWAFGFPAILAALQSLAMLSLPESPKWLLERGYHAAAEAALSQIYGNTTTASIMSNSTHLSDPSSLIAYNINRSNDENPSRDVANEVQVQVQMQMRGPVSDGTQQLKGDWDLILDYRNPAIVVIVIQILSQFTGGVVVRNYAPEIFERVGYGNKEALTFNIILGVIKLVVSIFCVIMVEHTGRKSLLLMGSCLVGCGMLLVALGNSVIYSNNDSAAASTAIFLVGTSLATAGYSLGYGPIPWLLSSECFPTVIRGRIMSISLLFSNLSQLVTNLLFLPLIAVTSSTFVFFLFFLLNIFTFLYVYFAVVETKSIEPDEVLRRMNYQWGVLKSIWNLNARGAREAGMHLIVDDASSLSTSALAHQGTRSTQEETTIEFRNFQTTRNKIHYEAE